MPSSHAVHEQLTDILVRVVGCEPAAVVPGAKLTDLGVDSLTVVETGEELGRRFDLYLSDDAIDGLVTVQDAIDAVVDHDGTATSPGQAGTDGRTSGPAPLAGPSPGPAPVRDVKAQLKRRNAAVRFAIVLAIVGGVVGIIVGLGGAALVTATGLGSVDLPPVVAPTTTPTPSPTPKPTPTATETPEAVPKPSLSASSETVAPGERFRLEGAFPALDEGVTLQVQVRDGADSPWDEFPIDTTTRADGKYRTEIYTSRTGTREFRMLDKKSGNVSPVVSVEIG